MGENKYRTSGVIDETTYRELGKVSLSHRFIWGTRITAVVTVIFALFMLIARKHFFCVIFAVLAVLFFRWPGWVINSYRDSAVKRLHEAYPAGFIQMETWFTEEGVAIHNLSDGGQLALPYGTLRRVAETERYFYLVTGGNQFTLVFKELLTPEQRGNILPFLREKCPDIKVVR